MARTSVDSSADSTHTLNSTNIVRTPVNHIWLVKLSGGYLTYTEVKAMEDYEFYEIFNHFLHYGKEYMSKQVKPSQQAPIENPEENGTLASSLEEGGHHA